jgi:hypothetical protein
VDGHGAIVSHEGIGLGGDIGASQFLVGSERAGDAVAI